MRKFIFYLLLVKKFFLLFIYPMFLFNGKIFERIRYGIENYIVFQPSKLRAKRIDRKLLKKFTPQRFVTLDGVRIYGWYIKPKDATTPVILHFHGQAESILSNQDVARFALDKGYGLFLLSYRGHYRSAGRPSEKGIYTDAQTAISKLKELGVEQERIILWGHSLGTTVALETALHNSVQAVIVQSSIKEIRSAAVDVVSFYCKRMHLHILKVWLTQHLKMFEFVQKFDNTKKIKNIKCPILLIHSMTDRIAPCQNSIDLFKMNKNAHLFLAKRGSHWRSDWAFEDIQKFLQEICV